MKTVLLYTDGSCLGNPGPGGWGVILKMANTSHSKELSGGYRLTTNNRMEILAAIEGLGALNQLCAVELYSDSQYLCNAVVKGWIYSWQRKNWMREHGKPVPNKDLWLRLLPLLAKHKINFNWLRGHAGHPENERCDQMARAIAAHKDLPADEPYEMLVNGQKQVLV